MCIWKKQLWTGRKETCIQSCIALYLHLIRIFSQSEKALIRCKCLKYRCYAICNFKKTIPDKTIFSNVYGEFFFGGEFAVLGGIHQNISQCDRLELTHRYRLGLVISYTTSLPQHTGQVDPVKSCQIIQSSTEIISALSSAPKEPTLYAV